MHAVRVYFMDGSFIDGQTSSINVSAWFIMWSNFGADFAYSHFDNIAFICWMSIDRSAI